MQAPRTHHTQHRPHGTAPGAATTAGTTAATNAGTNAGTTAATKAAAPARVARRAWRLPAAAALGLALAACGGGGGGGGGTPAAADLALGANFYPLHVGDVWAYSTSNSDGSATPDSTVRATASRSVDGVAGTVLLTDDGSGDAPSSQVVLASAAGIDELPDAGSDALTLAVGRIRAISLPLHAGDVVTQVDKTLPRVLDIDGDGQADSVVVKATLTVVGLEAVSTPAGSFANCLHQRINVSTTFTLAGSGIQVPLAFTVDEWYAPDVGRVKLVTLTRSGLAAVPDVTSTQLLSAYRVGERRSLTAAPTVSSRSPLGDVAVTASATVSLGFSQVMDAASLVNGLSLLGPDGQAVAATVQANGRSASLQPGAALASGRYTVQLGAGVSDVVGNALAGGPDGVQRWQFDVDADAPALLSSSPAANAANVALDSAIVLRMSEPLDPATVNAASFALSDGSGALATRVSLSADGATVTLTPSVPLQRARFYQVAIGSGVRDRLGNTTNTSSGFSFRSDAGRFAAPLDLLAGAEADAMAIADINGDGRADVLISTGYSFNAARDFKLLVYARQADGTLAAPQWLDTQASYTCRASSLQVADLDGDGLMEVVLGTGCGIEIFHQDGSGRLVSAQFIATALSNKLQVADMDGDGRPDLVGAGWSGDSVGVWRQTADHGFVLQATPAASYSGWSDLAVGDLNGDGRPDIVVSSWNSPLAIVMQLPDGSFAAPQLFTPALGASVNGVAVGDVNGDGRADLVMVYGGNAPASKLGLRYQQADGSLGPLQAFDSKDSPTQLALADINGDGRLDVLVGHWGWGSLGAYLQAADGTLLAETLYPGPYGNTNAASIAVGDTNGDGRPDVLLAGQLLLQQPVAAFAQGVVRAPGVPGAAALAARLPSGLWSGLRAALAQRLVKPAAAR